MKSRSILALAVLALMALAFVAPMAQADSEVTSIEIVEGKNITVQRGNTVTIHLAYTATQNANCIVSLYDVSSTSPIWSDRMTINVGTYDDFEIPITYDKKGASSVSMKITFMNGSTEVYKDLKFTLTYATSIWDNGAIYGAIIVIIILVVAFIVYRSRTSAATKNKLTFEQIEAAKATEKAPQNEKTTAKKSERQRYLDSKKK